MNTLRTALTELKNAERISKSDPFESPKETRAGYQALIAQMKEKMPSLVSNYFKELEKIVYKVYLTGSSEKNQKFVDLLSKEAVVFAPADVYGEIANRVMPTLGADGNFTAESWRRYIEVVGELTRKYGLVAKVLPVEPAGVGSSNIVELRSLIKRVTEAAYGWDLNKSYLYEQVYKKASNLELKDDDLLFIPIYVDDLNERDIINVQAFANKPSYTVTFKEDEEPTAKAVQQLIKQVQKREAK